MKEQLADAPAAAGAVAINLVRGPVHLSPTTTPRADRCSYFQPTIGVGGVYTLDLLAAPGVQDDINGLGKSCRAWLVINGSASNALTIAPGSNPFEGFGGPGDWAIPAGGWCLHYAPPDHPVTPAGHEVDISAPEGTQFSLGVVMG